jgi:hypothetical protein
MAILNSYVKLPEGTCKKHVRFLPSTMLGFINWNSWGYQSYPPRLSKMAMGNLLSMEVLMWKSMKLIYKRWILHCHIWLPESKCNQNVFCILSISLKYLAFRPIVFSSSFSIFASSSQRALRSIKLRISLQTPQKWSKNEFGMSWASKMKRNRSQYVGFIK